MVPLLRMTQYTGPARHVMLLAEQQALAANAPAITTGHILLGLLHEDQGAAARALKHLGITVDAVRQQLDEFTRPDEDGASAVGIPRSITFTRMVMGMLAQARLEWPKTGHADENQKRTPEGYPYLCTGEVLVAMIDVRSECTKPVTPAHVAEAIQVLTRLGVDPAAAFAPVLELVRMSPADERWQP
jgi:ATP-dependent Clp protease ATP-binding subunit ClpC